MSVQDFSENYRGKKGNENAVQSTNGKGKKYTYKPAGKDDREARRLVWERFCAMRDSQQRKDAEKRWDLGDKMYRLWAPERDAEDWRADIILPDGFAAVQTHMQETIQLRPRPMLEGVESSDETLEAYVNHIFQFAMDKTEFDVETYKARNCAGIRGDAFTIEDYRYETRQVEMPTSYKDGEIKYKKIEKVDFDDVYTRFVDNWAVYFDDTVDDYKNADDWIEREVLDYEVFKATYGDRSGFIDVDKVVAAGQVSKQAGFFQQADDVKDKDVEILHYESKSRDAYYVLANNVLIRKGPLPNTHKELRLDKWTFYPIPGVAYGMGIPFIIHTLVEERRTGRNLSADRNKMALQKMFFTNDLFEIDEDDLTPRPHGLVKVNTNGLPLSSVIQPIEYGDVPASSIRFDDSLLMEERRAHGLDDRPAQTAGGTATESAIISEAAQKRINLINTLQNWTTLTRLGIKKWKNIQFFYPAGRMEEIMEGNDTKKKQVYKTVKVEGRQFKIKGNPEKGAKPELIMAPYNGSTRVKLDGTYSQFMQDQYDIIVDAASSVVESKSVKFARLSELFNGLMANPITSRFIDAEKGVKRTLMLANEKPADWMHGEGMSEKEMRGQAELENELMASMAETGEIFALPGTPGATEAHTEVHLDFTETEAFSRLPKAVKDVIMNHIMEEHENNPNTGSVADKLKELSGGGVGGEMAPGGGPVQGGGGNAVIPGAPGGAAISADPGVTAPVAGGDVTAALA